MMWEPYYTCIKCDAIFNGDARYYYDGVCPECGNKSFAVVDCIKRIRRWVVDIKHPWWMFWKYNEGHWEYPK